MEKKSRRRSNDTEPKKEESDLNHSAKEIDELFARARQTVKPIITREAANEIVTEDVLSFRMKS